MARWWEWDGTQAGPNAELATSTDGDFRFPFAIAFWIFGAGCMVFTVGAMFFRAATLSTWSLLIGMASLALAWTIWPKTKPTKRT